MQSKRLTDGLLNIELLLKCALKNFKFPLHVIIVWCSPLRNLKLLGIKHVQLTEWALKMAQGQSQNFMWIMPIFTISPQPHLLPGPCAWPKLPHKLQNNICTYQWTARDNGSTTSFSSYNSSCEPTPLFWWNTGRASFELSFVFLVHIPYTVVVTLKCHISIKYTRPPIPSKCTHKIF